MRLPFTYNVFENPERLSRLNLMQDAADFRQINVGKVSLRAMIRGEGPLVVLVHGFPDSWYTWRHQIGPIVENGFTACAIDVRGYGGSDKPFAVEEYTLEELSNDVAGLISVLSPKEPAVLIGHDWGSPISWTTGLVNPDRVRAIAGLSVPYAGIPNRSLDEVIDWLYTKQGKFFYQEYFAKEGVAERELEVDIRQSLRRFFYAWSAEAPHGTWRTDKALGEPLFSNELDPGVLPGFMTEEDLDYYAEEFQKSGFRGPLNRYRNHTRDFHFLQKFKGREITQPTLYIAGESDGVLKMFGDRLQQMRDALPNLQGLHLLPNCGHWTQHEQSEKVTELLVQWLREL